MRKLGLGCRIAEVYVAAVFFADDIILISPNREAVQLMLNVCERWSKENGITFSTHPSPSKSKTKAMRISHKTRPDPAPLLLDGKHLPYVDSLNHLGHILSKNGTMTNDIKKKE